MIKLVIFDFDGTVVDSKVAYYNAIIKHVNPLGFSKKRITEVIDLGMNLGETLRKFIPSAFYRWWLKRSIMKDVLHDVDVVKKCRDAEHIKDIHTKKILISNSLREFVTPVLRHLKLNKVFSEIYCADDFDDKTKFISSYLKDRKIKPRECFYVGDRVADIKLVKKVGCNSMIVYGKCSWNSKKDIMKAKPDFVIPDLIFLKRIVERFKSET